MAALIWGLTYFNSLPAKASLEIEEVRKVVNLLLDNKVNQCISSNKDVRTLVLLDEIFSRNPVSKISKEDVKKITNYVDTRLKKEESHIKAHCNKYYDKYRKIVLGENE